MIIGTIALIIACTIGAVLLALSRLNPLTIEQHESVDQIHGDVSRPHTARIIDMPQSGRV